MANPRKFSEKIALHTQKQAEETAAFEQIMRDVQNVTTTPTSAPQPPAQQATARQPQPHLLNAISNASFRGGSLPNVNQMAQHRGDRTPTRQFVQLSTSPRASQNKLGPIRGGQKVRADHAPYASPPSLSQLNAAVAGGTSPTLPGGSYGSNNYLLPPENAWRRANSDSAINSINSLMIPSVVPDSSEESSNNSNDPRDGFVLTGSSSGIHQLQHHPLSLNTGNKGDGSIGVIPTTVGDGPNLLEVVPNSVSTGSLPDLTNFQFQTPVQQPVEIEDPHNNTSPYSTSPISMTYSHSPTSCSPHSQQQPTVTGVMPQQQQQVVPQSQHGLNQKQQQPPRSPIPSHHPQHHTNQQQHSPQQAQQHSPQQNQPHQSPQQQQQHSPNPLLDNPLSVNTSFQQTTFTPNENMLTAYRCPPRPSPQNSPSPFRSPSPHDGQLSAPPSPSNQPQSADSFYLSQQATALQQHFEQISMVDGQSQRNPNSNNGHWQQGGGMVNNSVYFYNSGGQQQIGATAGVTTQQSPSHHQPQTPQTPSSIPDIIFTDCTDPLEDFLTSEAAAAAFREGLGPIDTGDFQMLADPNLVLPDPQAEDTFRLDRL